LVIGEEQITDLFYKKEKPRKYYQEEKTKPELEALDTTKWKPAEG
jgi:hypothetical protein